MHKTSKLTVYITVLLPLIDFELIRHPFKYPADRVANINKKISISIKFPDGMKIAKTGISFTELKHLIERLEVVC